ncbi:MAG: AAA family ATPase [Bacteroidota bacterium]
MIPLKLKIKGIYSYIEEQTIDFSNLTDSSLFGIFGAVGSGKSTVLEAITFALYGDTERLNSRDSRAYNMMNLKSNELLIDFEFYTDTRDKKYRFIVKGKRNRNNFNDVKTFERSSLESTGDGSWLPTEKSATDIIGLSYKNFKRTIIIPQGKFKEFLELTAKDRTEMLNEIFHLQRFDLAPKLGSIKNKNEESLNILSGEMKQYEGKNPEVLKNLESDKALLTKKELTANEEIKKLRDNISEQNKLKELFESLSAAESKLGKLDNLKGDFEKRKTELTNYSYCRINFSELLNTEYRIEKEIKHSTDKLSLLKNSLEKNEENKNELASELKLVQKIYDKKDELTKEAEELEIIISIRNSIADNEILSKRIEKGNRIIVQEKSESNENQKILVEKKSELKKLKEDLPNISILHNVKNHLIKQNNLENQLKDINTEINKSTNEISSIKNQIKTDIEEKHFSESISEIRKKTDDEIDFLKSKRIELNEKQNHTLAQEKLKNWADDLVDGTPCPVCGSEHHPHILNISDLQNEISEIKKKDEYLEKTLSKLNKQNSILDIIEHKLSASKELLSDNTSKKIIVEKEISAHNNSFQWEQFKDISLEKTDRLISDTEKLSQQINNLEESIALIENKSLKLRESIDRNSEGVQKLKNKLIADEATIESKKGALKRLSLKQVENEDNNSLTKSASQNMETVKKAEIDFERISKETTSIITVIAEIKGQEKEITEKLKTLDESILDAKNLLSNSLAKSEYSSLEVVKRILSKKIDEQDESKIISDFELNLKLAAEELNKLKKISEGKIFDANLYSKTKEELSHKEAELKKLTTQIGVLQGEISKLTGDLEKKNILEKENESLLKRKDNINILSKLFKSKGFVNYISTVYLHNLSEAANNRFFKMTKQQLQLEITDSNEFQIRDLLNEGKTRNIKTLSGGQMFQASLSLALALADSVQSQVKADNKFFFLDEGFGSLDDESLHIVFEALKSLKNENRIVGIISHVESLKQEIDIHLQVNKDDETGSIIRHSWE